MINYEDFSKIDLKVGQVREAERVEGSEKLIKLKVDLGDLSIDSGRDSAESHYRQIVAGIGKFYEPENLIGKNIIIVANLEPRSFMGLESQGMLLAADNNKDILSLLTVDRDISPGSKIK